MSDLGDGVHEGRLILHNGKGRIFAISDLLQAFVWNGDIEHFTDTNEETA